MFNYSILDNPQKAEKILYGYGFSGLMKTMFGKIEIMWAQGDKNIEKPGEKSNQVYFLFGFNL